MEDMEEVNWSVFQAAAALVGGAMAAQKNNFVAGAIEKDFAEAYRQLLKAARVINQEALEERVSKRAGLKGFVDGG